jgi:integrase
MGRRRLHSDPKRPLPPGLYLEGRQYRARLSGQPWTYFGEDYVAAVAAYAAWRHDGPKVETVGWLLDLFVGQVCPAKVKARRLAPRTARDYLRDSAIIKKGIGHIPLAALGAKHVAGFRDVRGQDAPSHVRNEMACLSAALSYAVESGRVASNVAKDVRRPCKSVRQRLITDSEYLQVYGAAGESVRLAMVLAVRTLGLPADILAMGPRNIVRYQDGKRTLRFSRGKTGVKVEIEIVGELAAALEPFLANPSLHPSFIRTREGVPYTVDGIGAMFRRHCLATKVADFGIRDLRAKGATDMYRAGIDVRTIQRLLGHMSVQTTEIYLKGLLAEIVRPNEQPILAGVK